MSCTETTTSDLEKLQREYGRLPRGVLDFKESYAKAFYSATAESIASNEYDVSKLSIVLNAIQHQCIKMAEQMR